MNAKGLQLIDEASGHGLSMRPAERADRRESWDALRAFAGADRARGIRVEGEVLSEPSDRDEVSWQLVLHRWSPLEFGACHRPPQICHARFSSPKGMNSNCILSRYCVPTSRIQRKHPNDVQTADTTRPIPRKPA